MTTEAKKQPVAKAPAAEEAAEKITVMSVFATILREIGDFKGWELIFQVLLYGFIAWALYCMKNVYDLHTLPEYAHIKMYSIYDFKLALLMVIVFLAYKWIIQQVIPPLIKDKIKLDKYPTDQDKALRLKVVSVWIGNIFYYTGSSFAAYYLFKDQFFFPKTLGGTGTHIEMFSNMPYVQNIPNGVTFYMVQFGSHLYTLIDYCVYKRKAPQFWEMFLHHSMAVFLIFFSYMTGGIRIGILVLLVHDPCDVLVYLNRLFADWKNPFKPMQYANYIILVFVWAFLRLYAFPKAIVGACFAYLQNPNTDLPILYQSQLFETFMLTALVILHIYWYVFILRVFVNMAKGKKHYNVYDVSTGQKKET